MFCNNMVVGGDAVPDDGSVACAVVRSLIARSLPDTQQLCAVTEERLQQLALGRNFALGNIVCYTIFSPTFFCFSIPRSFDESFLCVT